MSATKNRVIAVDETLRFVTVLALFLLLLESRPCSSGIADSLLFNRSFSATINKDYEQGGELCVLKETSPND